MIYIYFTLGSCILFSFILAALNRLSSLYIEYNWTYTNVNGVLGTEFLRTCTNSCAALVACSMVASIGTTVFSEKSHHICIYLILSSVNVKLVTLIVIHG